MRRTNVCELGGYTFMIIYDKDMGIGIDEEGFIDKSDLETYISKSYKTPFDFIQKLNIYMYSLYNTIEPKNDDEIGCFFIATYNKIHKSIQAAAILASRGLEDEVRIIARSVIDKIMIIKAVHNDEANYNKWINHQKSERYRLIQKIKNGAPGVGHLKERIIDLDLDNEKDKGQYISQIKWAGLAGLERDYNTAYSVFSGNVHNSLSSLRSDFIFEKNILTAMSISPKHEDICALLATLATDALRAVEIIIKYYSIDDTKYVEFESELESIWKQVVEN